MYKTETDRITVDVADLDVKATLECGQLFRFEKIDDAYIVKSGAHSCRIVNSGSSVVIETRSTDYFVNFFNLDRDMNRAKRELSRFPELKDALESCGALRILHQPLFETIISFIISANNNIPRIKGIINRLCAQFGDEFPAPDKLAGMQLRQLDAIGCGYRSRYILESAKICAETDLLNRLYSARTPDAAKLLMTLPGVGQKIADCVRYLDEQDPATGHGNGAATAREANEQIRRACGLCAAILILLQRDTARKGVTWRSGGALFRFSPRQTCSTFACGRRALYCFL